MNTLKAYQVDSHSVDREALVIVHIPSFQRMEAQPPSSHHTISTEGTIQVEVRLPISHKGSSYTEGVKIPPDVQKLETCIAWIEHIDMDAATGMDLNHIVRDLLRLGCGTGDSGLRSRLPHALCGGATLTGLSFADSGDIPVQLTQLALCGNAESDNSPKAQGRPASSLWMTCPNSDSLGSMPQGTKKVHSVQAYGQSAMNTQSGSTATMAAHEVPVRLRRGSCSASITRSISHSPESELALPKTFKSGYSPSSFLSSRSTYTSPAFSVGNEYSPASFTTARSAYTSPAFSPSSGASPAIWIETTRNAVPSMPAPLQRLKEDYYSELRQQNIIKSKEKELNWSGKGQHVTYLPKDSLPLTTLSHLGASTTAKVDEVLCRRISLARKTIRCSRQWTIIDALREVYHLESLRHFHIVQLVGSYLQGRDFSILMYPVADYHLGTFLEDTADMTGLANHLSRIDFLWSSLGCLTSAVVYIHTRTTKHMDIKPHNILVRKSQAADQWVVYLADFGLSRSFASQGHSQTDGPTSLTPRYCAPEVFHYERRGRSADVFSLGCVFSEIMTVLGGKHPHDFADARRSKEGNESFHSSLLEVTTWLETVCSDITLDHKTSTHLSFHYETLQLRRLCDMIKQMIELDPNARPTARMIQEESLFEARSCCGLRPEPYVAYEAP